MPTQPAVLGSARLNNFRLDYLTADQAARRPAAIWISLGGVDITSPTAPTRVIHNSMSIRDLVFDTPNTCNLTFYGVAPVLGSRLEIWANRNEPALLFGGELQTVDRTYKGRSTTVIHPCTAIDDTARANRRRPLGLYTNLSATTIAQTLISTYAPGYSSAGVEANLPAVTVNFDGSEGGMKGCLTQLAKLIGGYWYFENRTLYLFVTPPGPAPDPINDTPGRFLHDPQIRWSVDKSQVRTRVYGKGASTTLTATVDPTITILPLGEVAMFNPLGGTAIAAVTPDGAASRVLTYTGVQVGGGGGLVGPGAAPSSAPGLALVTGTGIESGAHGYAITFVTAVGESLPSPTSTITVGAVAAPPAPVLLAPVTAGPGPSPGGHDYAVTFVTASGETNYGGIASMATGVSDPPETAPTPGAATAGGSVDPGSHQYAVTFVTAIGETTSSPASAPVETLADVGGHDVVPPTETLLISNVLDAMTTAYQPGDSMTFRFAYVNAAGVTTAGPLSAPKIAIHYGGQPAAVSQGMKLSGLTISPDPSVTTRRVYRYKNGVFQNSYNVSESFGGNYTDGSGETLLGVPPSGTNTAHVPGAAYLTVPLSGIPKGASGSGVTARKLYRVRAGWWYLVTTIANNTTTTYTDTTADASLGAAMPSTNTAHIQQIRVTVPLGPPLVTARKIYRSTAPGLGLLLAATLADNTTTAWTDTVPDASLGAAAPSVNTAAANQVQVTFPLGGSSVTERKLYRTAANQTPLQFLFGVANNTQTAGTDIYSDAILGAAPPVADTSGLKQPEGQLLPGTTTVIVANADPFAATGGWAVIGNGEQVIRYAAKTANTLTGVPASGLGAIVAAVSYNSTITSAPALVGVAGILEVMLDGSPVHVWVQRDDLAAQASMAALDGSGDGVYEHIVSDERRTEASLAHVCDAELALYGRPLVTVTYASRDTKTKSGKTVQIALASPAMAESLTIQDVAISEIGIAPTLKPKFTVTASSVTHSFDAILRMLIGKANA